MAFQDGLFFLE